MSAYIVERKHIAYLVVAMQSKRIRRYSRAFHWYHNGRGKELTPYDDGTALEVAQLLWNENIKSIHGRYPDTVESREYPGADDDYEIRPGDVKNLWDEIDPVQLLKSIHCYEYQSCEHDEWKTSEARAIMRALESEAIQALTGYSEAEWGAPKTREEKREEYKAKQKAETEAAQG